MAVAPPVERLLVFLFRFAEDILLLEGLEGSDDNEDVDEAEPFTAWANLGEGFELSFIGHR